MFQGLSKTLITGKLKHPVSIFWFRVLLYEHKSTKLDWESIRSSPRDGSSSTSNGLTKGWLGFGGWLGVVGWVVGPQYFRVIP